MDDKDQPKVIYVREDDTNRWGMRRLHLYKERPEGYDERDGWQTLNGGDPAGRLYEELRKAKVVWLPRGAAIGMPMRGADLTKEQVETFLTGRLEEENPLPIALEGWKDV